jgi:hypothetical protein
MRADGRPDGMSGLFRWRAAAVAILLVLFGVGACSQPGQVPSAAQAGMVTQARYADGIPRELNGVPVLRGDAALTALEAKTAEVSVLVGGWLTVAEGVQSCPLLDPALGWFASCAAPILSDVAGSDVAWPGADRVLRFAFASVADLHSGAAILRVHTHDARAAQCGTAKDACERAVVVDAIPWSGDAVTAPHPLTAPVMQRVLQALQPGASVLPLSDTNFQADCGSSLAAGRIYPVAHPENSEPVVTWVGISPSPAAAARSVDVATGLLGALSPAAVQSTGIGVSPAGSFAYACRWLRVENVSLLVVTAPQLTTDDRAFLEHLATAMESVARQ